MAGSLKFWPILSSIKLSARWNSTLVKETVGIKERMHKFIIENPHLSESSVESLNLPAVKKVSRMQEELLRQIRLGDLDRVKMPYREIKPNSRENPNILGSNEIRKVQACMCELESHFVRYTVLYRDLPTRCYCGNWFMLVDLDRLENEREKKWNHIKNLPENAELLQRLDETEKEMNILLEQGKSLTLKSPNSDEMMEKLGEKWKDMKNIYFEIRKRMELD